MQKNKTSRIVLTAMMMGLIIVATILIRVPIPFTQGYVHLGDAMIFMAVIVLGWKWGAVAAGVGSALGDIIGGFPIWAPWTLVIKGLMAVILGLIIEKNRDRITVLSGVGMIVAGLFMTAGYYAAEGFIYGNWAAPIIGVPWNIGQFAVGMVLAYVLTIALDKTPAGRFFTYHILPQGGRTCEDHKI